MRTHIQYIHTHIHTHMDTYTPVASVVVGQSGGGGHTTAHAPLLAALPLLLRGLELLS